MDRSSNDKLQEAYKEVYLQEKGMSSDAMSSVLKGHKYSKKQLFDMSKKSTKEGRHGEAHALYKEFQKSSYEPDSEMVEGYDKPDEKLKTDRDMFNVPKDEQSAARKRILAKALAKRKEKGIKEATYPSDFINPDGSKRAVAKKKTDRPIQHDQPTSGGRRKTVDEEASDAMKDRRMERGGVDGNTRYDRAPKAPNTKKFGTGKTMAQKEMEKKYGKGATAMDVVKANIRAKHGKGAIMDTKKK